MVRRGSVDLEETFICINLFYSSSISELIYRIGEFF